MIRERDFGFTPNASFPANQRYGYLRRQRRDLYNPQFAAGKLFAPIPFRYQGNAEAGFDTALLRGDAIDKRGFRRHAHIGRESL